MIFERLKYRWSPWTYASGISEYQKTSSPTTKNGRFAHRYQSLYCNLVFLCSDIDRTRPIVCEVCVNEGADVTIDECVYAYQVSSTTKEKHRGTIEQVPISRENHIPMDYWTTKWRSAHIRPMVHTWSILQTAPCFPMNSHIFHLLKMGIVPGKWCACGQEDRTLISVL